MKNCIFCQIIKGKIPSYKIYEDDKYLAFLDVFPFTPGHTLVIPKKHVEFVWDYDSPGEYFKVVSKIAKSMRAKTSDKIVRSGIVGVDVPHAHIHLFPEKKNKFKTSKQLSADEMENCQKKFAV